jgi:hypothetical protein
MACDNDCDTMIFHHPGECPICHMQLVRQVDPAIAESANEESRYNGHWDGVATTTDQQLRFSLDIATKPLEVVFNSPDLKALKVTARNVKFDQDTLQFELAGDDDIILCRTVLSGDSLRGSLVTHLDAVAVQNRIAGITLGRAPVSEINYIVREVVFYNGVTKLAGSLYLPTGGGSHPALVCNHSSGDKPRYDGAYMADFLARRGIVVLIYDKRGNGQSGGDWKTSTFEDLADDCIAGVKFLQGIPQVKPRQIGIFGHSQGGTISPIIVARDKDIAFNIAAAGFAVSPEAQDIFRVTNILRNEAHFKKAVVDSAIQFYKIWLEVARTGRGRETLEAAKVSVQGTQWYDWVAVPPKESWVWNWYLNAGNYNYIPYWEKERVPTLLIYGEDDQITPVKPSVTRIEAALKKARNQKATLIIMPKSSHYFTLPKKEGDLWEKSTPGYLEAIYTWIEATCGQVGISRQ